MESVTDTSTERPVVFLLGLHGTGKTSVGRALEASHGFTHLSVGDLGRLARLRKAPADYSLRLMCMLAGQDAGMPLRHAVVDELLRNVTALRMRGPVSVDGFPCEPAHLDLLPANSHVFLLQVPEDVRQMRLQVRGLTSLRKWTPGSHSVRDASLPVLLDAGKGRIKVVDAHQDLITVVDSVLGMI